MGCGALAGGVRDCIVLIVGLMRMLDGVWEVVMGCGADWRMGLAGGVAWPANGTGWRNCLPRTKWPDAKYRIR